MTTGNYSLVNKYNFVCSLNVVHLLLYMHAHYPPEMIRDALMLIHYFLCFSGVHLFLIIAIIIRIRYIVNIIMSIVDL